MLGPRERRLAEAGTYRVLSGIVGLGLFEVHPRQAVGASAPSPQEGSSG